MSLWKRTLSGLSIFLFWACFAAVGAMLPPEMIPPVSTVLAVLVIPVVVVGGSRVWSIRPRVTAETPLGSQSERITMGAGRST
jgi:hypothetical protein